MKGSVRQLDSVHEVMNPMEHQFLFTLVLFVLADDVITDVIDCNDGCLGNPQNICDVTEMSSMTWSHNDEETAPKPDIDSGSWFILPSNHIGLNLTWSQRGSTYLKHVTGYVISVSHSRMLGPSYFWHLRPTVSGPPGPSVHEKVTFNFHCFMHYNAPIIVETGVQYTINVYSTPVYKDDHAMLYDSTTIQIPDCSHHEVNWTNNCMDDGWYYDDDYPQYVDHTPEAEIMTSQPVQSTNPVKPIFLIALLLLVAGVVIFITWIVHKLRSSSLEAFHKRTSPGSIFIFCDPSTSAAPLTSILATLLKLYAKRTVECNIWRQTVPNTLEWSRNAALAADQIIVIDGEPPFQINHSQTYLATFQPNELGKYKFPFTKRYLLMRDFKTFFKDFAADQSASCPEKQIQIISNATRQVQNAGLGTKMAAQSEPLMKSVNRDSGFSSHSFVL